MPVDQGPLEPLTLFPTASNVSSTTFLPEGETPFAM